MDQSSNSGVTLDELLPSKDTSRPATKSDMDNDPTKPESQNVQEDSEQVEGIRLALILTGLILAVFCLGLDNSILATAIPSITTDFNSLQDVAWYGSSYLLTTCCFQLTFGKLYAEFKTSWVFLSALGLFELGSTVCAASPNSVALIIGRAIAGIGCAGLLSGALIIISQTIPLHKRPIYTGVIGAISGISQIIAPTLGGVFTDRLSWRWCFWINLPMGAVTAVVIIFFVQLPEKKGTKTTTIRDLLVKLDVIGTTVFIPCIICLLLALQWGGTTYAWSSWRIILCLCCFSVLIIIWGFIEYRQGSNGMLPPHIIRQRSIAAGTFFMFGMSGSVFVVVYYVPIWFQAVLNVSAEQSGINFLTTSAAVCISSVLSGALATAIGYYVPQMILSTVLCSVAGGLLLRFDTETTTAYWIVTLILFGFAVGLGLQMPLTAAQTVLQSSDIGLGTSVLVLAQTLSGTIFLAVGQNLFQSRLAKELAQKAPQVDPTVVVNHGVSGLFSAIETEYGIEAARNVLKAYNEALRSCLMICVIISSITLLGALRMEWKNVKVKKGEGVTELQTKITRNDTPKDERSRV